jgi:SAM-dependent methyltransferase
MTERFDRDYWEQHWQQTPSDSLGSIGANPPNPHLVCEAGDLMPGTALDAGCGSGAEAIWLASRGWQVTAADISSEALARAAGRAAAAGVTEKVRWVEADLSDWTPGELFDLVTTHYAHPAMPQLDFYDRLASWVAPGGTLLIVGHLDSPGSGSDGSGHGHGRHDQPPADASATSAEITARLDGTAWEVMTADELRREVVGPGGGEVTLLDVVVRARRT